MHKHVIKIIAVLGIACICIWIVVLMSYTHRGTQNISSVNTHTDSNTEIINTNQTTSTGANFNRNIPPAGSHENQQASATALDSTYALAPEATLTALSDLSGTADIVLGAINFNATGGGLLFNHPGGIATDGTRLLMADKNNNRVLIWNTMPRSNTAPDLVLGQNSMDTNNPGTERNQLNWPTAVTISGDVIAVADTNNNRILIWNSIPTQNGQAADIVLQGDPNQSIQQRGNIVWPWGVWTNGEKFVVSSTKGAQLLIWNAVPTHDDQNADIVIQSPDLGTPRNIISDGKTLVVGDHNAFQNQHGTFFWSQFPTKDNAEYSFFMNAPKPAATSAQQNAGKMGEEMTGGAYTDDGKLATVTNSGVHIWNQFPLNADDAPDVALTQSAYSWQTGDGAGVAIVGNALYISRPNGNSIVAYTNFPSTDSAPDFAIGSVHTTTNTLEENYFITNPVPATDGEHLFVSSDFDRRLSVWKSIPNESNAKPDYLYTGVAGWDNALYKNTFVVAGSQNIYVWNTLPLNGELPKTYRNTFGSVQLSDVKGVALDETYLYIADSAANSIYVWEGIPEANEKPVYTLSVEQPLRLDSDGKHLAVTTGVRGSFVQMFDITDLSKKPTIIGSAKDFNLPMYALVDENHFAVADTGYNRVLLWDSIDDALAGKAADKILGDNINSSIPEIGTRTLFMPSALALGDGYFWVGEFKFSGRLLRFSAK